MSARQIFIVLSLGITGLFMLANHYLGVSYWYYALLIAPLILLGLYDMLQRKRTILRNFPIIGHLRYFFEAIRPEIQQYFVESNLAGRPINRENRSIVYQRAKHALQTLPFGTQRDVYEEGYEWVNHSLHPIHVDCSKLRVHVGGPDCKQPYSASIFNISAMSFGSLSANAIEALNGGAHKGKFYHNTGEGGISPYHQKYNGDLVWQVGTGYFGCRTPEGNFCEKSFQENAQKDCVKMIELKLSQGAKPGHGGILPGRKVTAEIAEIRGIEKGKDVLSPPEHKAFHDSKGLLQFIQKMRELSGGKPVGIKLCLGEPQEFDELCDQMIATGLAPDFISIDGGEGGTGAAPLEFSNHIGMPLNEALSYVHDTLLKKGLKDKIVLIAAGKVLTAFHMVKLFALGADIINSARGMMLALGCIQALRCHSNHCPTGVATNDPELVGGLVVSDKVDRVYRYHKDTVKAFSEILGAMGLDHPQSIQRRQVYRRVSPVQTLSFEQIYKI